MVYKIKLSALKSKYLNKLLQKVNSALGTSLGSCGVPDELKEDLIKKYVSNRSFADIGCMWRVNGYFSFLAEKAGAASVAAVDIYPASKEFNEEGRRLNSKVEFVQGDIHSQKTIEAIGVRDVVFCSGLLYHTPNPVDTLMKLRLICDDILILNTSTIPEMPGVENSAVFYPYLSDKQRMLWKLGEGQMGISTPCDVSQGYANWFWGFSLSCLEAMLQCAGFRVLERYGDGFLSCLVCQVSRDGFLPVSGDWTMPKKTKTFSDSSR